MAAALLVDETYTKITPADIDTSRWFADSFGKMERESSARWLVQLAQERGHWGAFTHEEIEEFYSRSGKYTNFQFNDLDREPWLYVADGKYTFTLQFVAHVYGKFPAAGAQK